MSELKAKTCCIKNCMLIPEACTLFPKYVGTHTCPLSMPIEDIDKLRERVKELEAENTELAIMLSKCNNKE